MTYPVPLSSLPQASLPAGVDIHPRGVRFEATVVAELKQQTAGAAQPVLFNSYPDSRELSADNPSGLGCSRWPGVECQLQAGGALYCPGNNCLPSCAPAIALSCIDRIDMLLCPIFLCIQSSIHAWHRAALALD